MALRDERPTWTSDHLLIRSAERRECCSPFHAPPPATGPFPASAATISGPFSTLTSFRRPYRRYPCLVIGERSTHDLQPPCPATTPIEQPSRLSRRRHRSCTTTRAPSSKSSTTGRRVYRSERRLLERTTLKPRQPSLLRSTPLHGLKSHTSDRPKRPPTSPTRPLLLQLRLRRPPRPADRLPRTSAHRPGAPPPPPPLLPSTAP